MKTFRRQASLFSFAFLASLAASITIGLASIVTWTTKTSMPSKRFHLAAATLSGRIYAVGGVEKLTANYSSINEEYDPSTDSWTSRNPMTTTRVSFGLVSASGKLYAIGGQGGVTAAIFSSVEEYDPLTDTWSARASMSIARWGLGVVTASNGKIYAIGGFDGSTFLNTVEQYDPLSNIWTTRASMPTARSLFGIAATNDGKIYTIGGNDGSGALNVVEEYDTLTDSWTSKGSLLTPRFGLGAVYASNGKIYAIAGVDSSGELNSVEEYNSDTDSWSTTLSAPTRRHYFGAAIHNNKIYVIGGLGDSGYLDANEEATVMVVSPSITTTSLATTTAGVAYSEVLRVEGGTSPFSWTINSGSFPEGLTLGSSNGEISGIPTTPGTYQFTVQVSDANAQTDARTLSIVVNPEPSIITIALSEATVTGLYSQTLQSTGGTTPLSWSVASGSLPSGLSLSSIGLLTGTVTEVGTYSFTVQVSDSLNVTTSKSMNLIVNAAPAVTRNNIPDVKVGHTYSQAITTSGGTTPLVWSVIAGGLPNGLFLNSSSGLIAGTPTTIGTYAFTIQVTDNNGVSATKAFSIRVKP